MVNQNSKHFSKALHVHIIKEVEMALSAELVCCSETLDQNEPMKLPLHVAGVCVCVCRISV